MNNLFICLGAVRLIVRLLHCLITTINNCYCLVGSILYLIGLCINCVTKVLNFPDSSMKYAVPGTRIQFFLLGRGILLSRLVSSFESGFAHGHLLCWCSFSALVSYFKIIWLSRCVFLPLLLSIDKDECQANNGGCDIAKGICINTPGSYHCACKQGYELKENSEFICEGRLFATENCQC